MTAIPPIGAMTVAFQLGLVASGFFLLWGMILGVWKFHHMRRPPAHEAPTYVSIAHRAALMYAFACLVLAMLAEFSVWGAAVNVGALVVNLLFFGTAVSTYVIHGVRGREGTQYEERNLVTTWGTWGLIVGELAGTAVLVSGVMAGIFVG